MTRWRDTADMSEKKLLFSSVLFVLKNVPKQLLHQWWNMEVNSRLLNFLGILSECAAAFQHVVPGEDNSATLKKVPSVSGPGGKENSLTNRRKTVAVNTKMMSNDTSMTTISNQNGDSANGSSLMSKGATPTTHDKSGTGDKAHSG